jgi:hypothetical protein
MCLYRVTVQYSTVQCSTVQYNDTHTISVVLCNYSTCSGTVHTAVAQRYWCTELQYHFKCNDLERSAPSKYVRFDVTSYNSVDKAAWLGKVTSQRHAWLTGNKMAAWIVAMATEKKQRCHVNVFSGTVVNWTCCVFLLISCMRAREVERIFGKGLIAGNGLVTVLLDCCR